MSEKQNVEQLRVKLLDIIPSILGMGVTPFFYLLCGHIGNPRGITPDALFKARKRGVLPYSYDDFSLALNKGMSDYLKDEYNLVGKKAAKREVIRRNWAENREFIELLLLVAYLPIDGPAPQILYFKYPKETTATMDKLTNGWEPRFMELTADTAAMVERNFDGYTSVTGKDCVFMTYMQRLSADGLLKLKNRLPSMECPPAGAMFKRMNLVELICWEAIRDRARSNVMVPLKGESWVKFKKKVKALAIENALALLIFLDKTLPGPNGVERFTEEEMNLFLMFKYYLTEEGKDKILTEMKADT